MSAGTIGFHLAETVRGRRGRRPSARLTAVTVRPISPASWRPFSHPQSSAAAVPPRHGRGA